MKLFSSHAAWATTRESASALFRAGIDTVLPPSCVLCAGEKPVCDENGEADRMASRHWLCEPCEHAIIHSWPISAVSCRFCGMPRPREAVPPHDLACSSCPKTAFLFDEVISLAIYQQAVREAVVAAKLSKHSSLATALGILLGEEVAKRLGDASPDLITYVPSHFARRIQRRGMGGVASMAAAVAQRLSKSASPLLRLTRHVGKQSMLPDADRPENVRGAFALKKSYAWRTARNLRNQRILLVDDVLTTGSTASEIASVLKNAGAASVTLAVVARAVRR